MKPERKVTDGGRLLRAYLTEIAQSVPDFCEEHELDRIQVQRVLNGERWSRITVDFAKSIDVATGGRVAWSTFLSKTAVPPAPQSGTLPTSSDAEDAALPTGTRD